MTRHLQMYIGYEGNKIKKKNGSSTTGYVVLQIKQKIEHMISTHTHTQKWDKLRPKVQVLPATTVPKTYGTMKYISGVLSFLVMVCFENYNSLENYCVANVSN